MVMIVLKVVLALLLTLVPFVFHYVIKPKASSSPKWRSFYSFLSTKMPCIRRKAAKVKAWISYVYGKMHRSRNGRKFFILVLLVMMLVFRWWIIMRQGRLISYLGNRLFCLGQ